MSLLIAIYCAINTFSWYWTNFADQNHLDTWHILKATGLSIVAGILVHRLIWILLNKVDGQFNNPSVLWTTLPRKEAVGRIRSHLKNQGFHDYERNDGARWDLHSCKNFSLVHINVFTLWHTQSSGYEWRGLQSGRALDDLPGPLGAVFRFLGDATWYTGDFSITLGITVSAYGLDDDCTLVKVNYKNEAHPPVVNFWGPFTRTILHAKIKSLIDSCSEPAAEVADEYEEPDLPAKQDVDRSRDYIPPAFPRDADQFNNTWNEASLGNAVAQYLIGNAYYDGCFVERDYERALQCYESAAEQKLPEAQVALSHFYRYGIVVERNEDRYRELSLAAAKAGDPDAMYDVGCLEMRKELRWEAVPWLEKAARLGHVDAMCYLAQLIDRYGGSRADDRSDGRKADDWYREAANRGSNVASFSLGHMRAKEGKTKNALAHFRKAATAGHAASQLELGYRYLHGDGVNQNLRRAQYWLKQAAAQNEPEAAEHLDYAQQQIFVCERLAGH